MERKAEGFLVVDEPISIKGIYYHGVNTNAWPIGVQFHSKIAANICATSLEDLSYPMLIDYDSALDYCHRCEAVGIMPRMLFCETMLVCSASALPRFRNPPNTVCLGFDYAYPSGDFYSSIANDILYREEISLASWKDHINQYGLLSTKDDLFNFASDRLSAVKEAENFGRGLQFEKGHFIGFHVFLVNYS